jgi:sugar lactone lactonase YvrE
MLAVSLIALSLLGHAPTLLAEPSGKSVHVASTLETLLAFDPSQGQLPESLTINADGELFLSMSNNIVKVDRQLTLSTYASLPLPAGYFALGLKFGPDDCLYVASGAFTASPSGAFVWRVCAPGQVEQFATLDANGFPNDLAFDDCGLLYVTDPFLGRIWRVDQAGQASVWLEHPLLAGNAASPVLPAHFFGVDGIAFNADKTQLFVGNLDYGSIVRIHVGRSGAAGRVETFVSDPLLRGADGLAFDADGTLYVAVNAQDRLVAISERGALTLLNEGAPLDAPSSLVFGTRGHEKKTLYISSFAINRALGQPAETPHPALLARDVKRRGLPLP